MTKNLTSILTFCLFSVFALYGCKEKIQNAPDRYNYQRALDAFESNNIEEAIQFCEKD